ncbi:MAG: cystathionine gamma-synthase [Sphingobacteriales bacterium]|nr:cystathionine gamma-synthase [Sphingobacteriales bacterium]
MKFATKLIHAGMEPEPLSGAIMTPIYQTSTYVQAAPGQHKGYEYARTQNPTRTALQANLAALENAKHGFSFGSGMAAIDAMMRLFNPGDEIVASNDLYGGTYRIFTKIWERYGLKFHFTDMRNLESITPLLNKNTRMIWLETPSNPMLSIIDIASVAQIARSYNILLGVDNTFASPYLQNPISLGADVVMHSVTKYIGGHSDVIGGALLCNDDDIAEKLRFIQNAAGAVPAPMDCFLLLRGIKTLHVRMERHCENALQIAQFLNGHHKVKQVHYPGLQTHPGHNLAKQQMRGFGGMLSFSLHNDSLEAGTKVLSGTHLFSLAESLGGVESLIGHPATMTHASIPYEERVKTGVLDSLIRLSVGIEDVDDLIEDLDHALSLV